MGRFTGRLRPSSAVALLHARNGHPGAVPPLLVRDARRRRAGGRGRGGSLFRESEDRFGLGEEFAGAFDLRDSEQLLVKLSYRFTL